MLVNFFCEIIKNYWKKYDYKEYFSISVFVSVLMNESVLCVATNSHYHCCYNYSNGRETS